MARKEGRRQAKLLKKRRREKAKRKAGAGRTLSEYQEVKAAIRHARRCPVYECLISKGWRDSGLAQILLSRRQPNGRIVFGVYLVDVLCLGLKNTFCNANFPEWKYRAEAIRGLTRGEDLVECPLDLAHTIIYGAIDYAARLGFQPNEDFDISRHVLEERDGFQWQDDVEFGRDGQPCFIAGPNDDLAEIMRQLDAATGEAASGYAPGPM
jgi:hypothetical protein